MAEFNTRAASVVAQATGSEPQTDPPAVALSRKGGLARANPDAEFDARVQHLLAMTDIYGAVPGELSESDRLTLKAVIEDR
jgi:hypothetical protein